MATRDIKEIDVNVEGSNNHYQEHHQKYNYMCNECGEALHSLPEYIKHYSQYHPKSIASAST
jgi:hypothetical protein